MPRSSTGPVTRPRWPWHCLSVGYLATVLLAIAVIMPPWQNPDEPFHMMRAVQLAHGGILGYRAWGSAGGDSDPAIYDAYQPMRPVAMHPERQVTRAALASANLAFWRQGTVYTPFPNTVQYGPALYVPAAIAYWVGRVLAFSIDRTLFLVRFFNALLFALIVTAALGSARRMRPLLAAIILLPTTLALGASASQDSLLLACTALVVGLLDRAIAEQRAATLGETWSVAGLLTAIAMARPPYAAFLLLLILATPPRQRASPMPLVAAFLLVLVWCLVVAWYVSINLGGADIHRQLAFLAAEPGRIPAIIANTATSCTAMYFVQFIGVLGWTDTNLPHAYIVFAGAVLALAAIASCNGAVRRPWLPWAATWLACVTIFILQYLTWTWPGQPLVTGVLGRYFLPIAMVLALGLPRFLFIARIARPAAWIAIGLQAAITPSVILHALILRYYLAS